MPAAFTPDLNPEQLAAVSHGGGPQLVLAGAGSGKTRVITYRVAWLVGEGGVDPRSIVAVTFTNKAADEMRERIEKLLGVWPLPAFVGTFHRFALGLLRRHGERVGLRPDFAIFDADDQEALVKKALAAEGLSEGRFAPRAVLAAISSAKNRLLPPDAYEAGAGNFFERHVAAVYRRYQGALGQAGAIDFDDMLALAVRLLEREEEVRERLRRRVQHLLVDEFQDTNHAQLRLILLVAGEAGNVTAVGDEDQGIYGWRGADLSNVLEFERSFPGAVVWTLEHNYRSTQTILSAASALVARNRGRRPKRLWTDAGAGTPIEVYRARDEGDESAWIVRLLRGLAGSYPLGETAVLVRTNAQTRAIEEELVRQGVRYSLVGGTRFYERAEIKDLIAYLRAIRNPRDGFSLLRILNRPPRGIGKATEELLARTAAEAGSPPWDVIVHRRFGGFSPRAAQALDDFRALILGLQRQAGELPMPAFLERLLEATGYLSLFPPGDPESEARIENLREFLSAAQEFAERTLAAGLDDDDLLTRFLDHVSLVSDVDEWDAGRGAALMTLHSAKGLEFSAVIVAGLEEGLLPHFNTKGEPDAIEEERRLLYVGMTRAKERLFLTTCRRRRVAGRFQDQVESPFLAEIPAELLRVTRSPALYEDEGTAGAFRFFGRRPAADLEFDQRPEPRIATGRRVRHPTLGRGVVVDLEGEGETMKLTVLFDTAGKRKLVAKYASLELL